MELKEVINKVEWEDFLKTCSKKSFLQSWYWGDFHLFANNPVWRLGFYDGVNLLGIVLVTKVSAKRGTFLLIQHGPVFMPGLQLRDKKEALELLLIRLNNIATEEKASFIRISPIMLKNQENQNIFVDLGFRNAPIHANAYEATWKLNISPGDDILHEMRKTTRYLIRKAVENPDISIEISSNPENLETYLKLNKEVAKRQKFVPFSDEYIKKEFDVFKNDNKVTFVFGKYKGEIACGAMIVFWSGIAFYHQAASLSKFAKLSIPYLLQWEAIKEAERRGCTMYDFWGFTDPEKFPKHPWAGPTLFKVGFGGYKEEYIQTQDFVLSQKYWISYIIEKIRRAKRGL